VESRHAAGALLVAGVLVGLAGTAGAAGGTIEVDPEPFPARGTATVSASFDEAVEEADVRACRADANGTILSCFRTVSMEGQGRSWTADVPPGGAFGDVAQAGVNVTGTDPGGADVHLPGNGSEYRFLAVAGDDGDRGLPGPGVAGAALAVLAAARVRSRP
jgi:hypothetical protein